MHVLRILFVAQRMQGQAKHSRIVSPHETVEGGPLPFLGLSD